MTTKRMVKRFVLVGCVQAAGLVLAFVVVELIPKTPEGYFEHPLDIFFIVLVLGCFGGAAIGLLVDMFLEVNGCGAYPKP